MDLVHGQEASELLQAQTDLYKHIYSYIDSMALKCAVQLGIPDIIHNHGEPITLHDLVSTLQIDPIKATFLHSLMRLLVHCGFFATRVHKNQEEEAYDLTPLSRILLKDNVASFSPLVLMVLDPALVNTWHVLEQWFRGDKVTPFESAQGMGFWDYCNQNPEFNNTFNDAMASDSRMMKLVIRDWKPIFEGLDTLVDVGGGTGESARIILEAFPHLRCVVFDLPHVVANLPESVNLRYVAGDMFQPIPSADAVLLKSTLHNWSHGECVNILKRCKEAISNEVKKGKVIIIDVVINTNKDEDDITKLKLCFDTLMMALFNGKERDEKQWEKIFLEAGFSHYKIVTPFGMKSVIEVYP